MHEGNLIILDERPYQVTKVIYSRKDEASSLLRVLDDVTGKTLGLKLVFGTQKLLDDIYQEVETLAKLDLPCLPAIQAFDVDEEKFWMLTDFIEGKTLRERMVEMRGEEAGRLAANLALCINLCTAIDEMHAQGYFHRDLKPENILLVGESETVLSVKIMDYSIRTLFDHFEEGALQYWPPELWLAGQNGVDPSFGAQADVFSLGLICTELLTGKLPTKYGYGDGAEWIKFEQPTKIAPDFPHQLESVLMKAVAFRKYDRFQSVEQFRSELERVKESLFPTKVSLSVVDSEDRIPTELAGVDAEVSVAIDVYQREPAKVEAIFQPVEEFDLPTYHAKTHGTLALYFLLLMGVSLSCIIVWDLRPTPAVSKVSVASKELPQETTREIAPEPLVRFTPVELATPETGPGPMPKPRPQLRPKPAPTSSTKGSDQTRLAEVLAETPDPQGKAPVREPSTPTDKPEIKPAVKPEPKPAVKAEVETRVKNELEPKLESAVPVASRVEIELCREEVKQCQLAVKAGEDDPNCYLRLAAALYNLGVHAKDPATLMDAKDNYSKALAYGADLVTCELAFRATELCAVITQTEGKESAETKAKLSRIYQTLLKAESRVSSGVTSLYGDWAFLVKLSLAYQSIVSTDDISAIVRNSTDEGLSSQQIAFLNQFAEKNECILPPRDLLSFMQL